MASFVFGCHFLAIVFSTWTTASSEDIFSSQSLQFSVDIDRRINENVNPCDDFYGYSCLNPTEKTATLHVASMAALQTIANRLFTPVKKPGDGEAVNKYYDLYNQCTAVHTGKNVNQTILDYVHDFDKLFEGADNHDFDATQLAKVSAYLLVHHDFSLITLLLKIKPVYKRFSNFRKVLSIEASKDLSRQAPHYFDPKNVDTFKNGLRTNYAHVNPTADEAYLNKTASDMYNLEVAMAEVVLGPLEIKNMRTLTVNEAMQEFPTVDWITYVSSLVSYSGVDLLNGTKIDDYPLHFDNTNTTKFILEVIAKTSPDLIRNYIKTRIAGQILQDCWKFTALKLPLVKQHLYITDMYPTAADRASFKRFATKIVDNIIASARKMLEEIPWIKNDKQMYAGATAKMDKLTKIIGYPDGLDDQAHLDRLHADFALSPNETLTSLYLKSSKFLAKSILEKGVVQQLDVTTVGAYYDPSSNNIFIPATMLRMASPNDIPAAIYGSIGTVIGHEVIHNFDNSGVHFDSDGYINPWMSQAGQASIDSMTQCVINEYNGFNKYDEFNYTDPNGEFYKVNGVHTAGENIADIGGLQAAYNAFLGDPEWNKIFPRTPKLKDITSEQLFFLAFNRHWCMPLDASVALHDSHAPYRIRVLGALRNFEPFRKAFNCPVNSRYAPEKHCDVYAPSEGSKSNAQSITSIAFTLMSVFLSLIVL